MLETKATYLLSGKGGTAIFIPPENTVYDQTILLRSVDPDITHLVSYVDKQLSNPASSILDSIEEAIKDGKHIILQGYVTQDYNPDAFDDTWAKLTAR